MAHSETPDGFFLAAAQAAAHWIRSTARPTEHGVIWLPDPDQPERAATVTAPATIYSGNAGIVLFFLELAQASGDESYLIDAQRGADHIAATWREVLAFETPIALENVNLTFKGQKIVFRLRGKGDLLLAKWALAKRCDLFEKYFGRVVIKEVRRTAPPRGRLAAA